jgi:uncharacterized membrane protein
MVFLITMVALAAFSNEPWFYLSSGEWKALRWLREEAAPDAVVLCAPQTGTFVPAWAGQPVVYGHPFETLNAERRKRQVKAYWSTDLSETQRDTFLRENRVRYILVGPRERALGVDLHSISEGATLVFEAECAKVFQISEY